MSAPEEAPFPDQPGNSAFTTTHWTVVLVAGETHNPQAAAALEHLCRIYWPPVYAFIRRTVSNPEDAKDLAQGFFTRFLEQKSFSNADPQRGRFRSFLLASVNHFLADEHTRATALKRGGGATTFSLNAEDFETGFEPGHGVSPEALFDHRWALTQLNRAIDQLAADYQAAGRGPLFELLQD